MTDHNCDAAEDFRHDMALQAYTAPDADYDTIRDSLTARVADLHRPNLGLATTRELLAEITARIEVDGYNGGGGLDYTTVGGRPEPAPGELAAR